MNAHCAYRKSISFQQGEMTVGYHTAGVLVDYNRHIANVYGDLTR
jgi:hypothetical protein